MLVCLKTGNQQQNYANLIICTPKSIMEEIGRSSIYLYHISSLGINSNFYNQKAHREIFFLA